MVSRDTRVQLVAVGPTDVGTVGLGVIAVTALGYLLAEATSGYRATRPS